MDNGADYFLTDFLIWFLTEFLNFGIAAKQSTAFAQGFWENAPPRLRFVHPPAGPHLILDTV
jgi:hypothetical protein